LEISDQNLEALLNRIKTASGLHNQTIKTVQITPTDTFPNDPFRVLSALEDMFRDQEGFEDLVLFQANFQKALKPLTSVTSAIPFSLVDGQKTHERFRYYAEDVAIGYGRVKDHIFMSFLLSRTDDSKMTKPDLEKVAEDTKAYLEKFGEIFQRRKEQMAENSETDTGPHSPVSTAASPVHPKDNPF